MLINFEEGFRSFYTSNIGFVGQRAAKLLVVKAGVLNKMSATSAFPAIVCASTFSPGSSWHGVKSVSKFDNRQL